MQLIEEGAQELDEALECRRKQLQTRPVRGVGEVYPGVPLTRPVDGRETLLAIGHARELLGYAPEHSWLDEAPYEVLR